MFWIGLYVFLFYLFLKSWEVATGGYERTIRYRDFLAFWTAARLALSGDALAAFDPAILLAESGLPGEPPKNFRWLYPPGLLVLVMPLGMLPFWAAWSVFSLFSLAALALAARPAARPLPGGWRFLASSPVLLYGTLMLGQTGALWTAALIAALWSMRQGRAASAGIWLALLTLKPQLGLLIPIALAADRQWRTIGWTSLFAVIMLIVSTMAFGPAYWAHFLAALQEIWSRIGGSSVPVERMVSIYAFARQLGLGHEPSLWVQWPASLLLAGAIAWTWSRQNLGPDLKAAMLCAAIPLCSPYAFYYEMPITLAAAMFLFRDGFGRQRPGALWLLIIWLGPIPMAYLPWFGPPALYGPVIGIVTVSICMARAWRRIGGAGPAAARPA